MIFSTFINCSKGFANWFPRRRIPNLAVQYAFRVLLNIKFKRLVPQIMLKLLTNENNEQLKVPIAGQLKHHHIGTRLLDKEQLAKAKIQIAHYYHLLFDVLCCLKVVEHHILNREKNQIRVKD